MGKTVVGGLFLAAIGLVATLMLPQTSLAQGKPFRNTGEYITGEIIPVGGTSIGKVREKG